MADAGMPDSGIGIRRLSGALGAEVTGVDLATGPTGGQMAAIKAGFLDHCVLVFPGQGHLTPAQQCAFAAHWGELHTMPGDSPSLDGNGKLFVLDFEGKKPPTDIWHSDVTLEECPPIGSVLLGRTIPVGGDTIFANQYLAYEALSEGMRAMLDGLKAVHAGLYWVKHGKHKLEDLPKSVHPVVRTHPETGRKALFVNSAYTSHFEGMTLEESQPLLQWLWAHCVQPNFTFRHRWTEGDLLIWDNRCLQHFAVADYGPQRRVMHRVTILGDKPF